MDIFGRLDRLEDFVANSKRVPLSSSVMLNEAEFYDLLRKLNERLAIVLVSHDVGFVSQLVQTVICVNRRVAVHPTSELTGEMISEMYGSDVRMVRHDHFH